LAWLIQLATAVSIEALDPVDRMDTIVLSVMKGPLNTGFALNEMQTMIMAAN
jgi:hypothetical protein